MEETECARLPAWAAHHAKEPEDSTVPKPIAKVQLKDQYLRQIFQGHKLYEGRPLNSRGFGKVQQNSWLGFHRYQSWHVIVQVTDIREYADVRSMLTDLGCRRLLPEEPDDLEHCVAVYHKLGEAYHGRMVAYRLEHAVVQKTTPKTFKLSGNILLRF